MAHLRPAALALPPLCLLISYDFESTRSRESYANGATFAYGHQAFLYPEGIPVGNSFITACEPTVAPNAENDTFWQPHSAMRKYLMKLGEGRSRGRMFQAIFEDLANLNTPYQRPLALMARPHAFDGQHWVDGVAEVVSLANMEKPNNLTMHDLLPTLEHHVSLGSKEETRLTYYRNMPHQSQLTHQPAVDAVEQGLAFFRALKTLSIPIPR